MLDFSIGKLLKYFYFKQTSGQDYKTTYSMEVTQADILIFGSSRALHHYVPDIFEDSLSLSAYNTGRGGQFFFYQTAILKSILKRYTPKIIVLDFSGSFEKDQEEYDRLSCLLPYYWDHSEIRKYVDLRSPFEKIKLISHIYPYNSLFMDIAIGNLKKYLVKEPDKKGFEVLNKQIKIEIDSLDSSFENDIDENKLMAFEEFLSLARSAGSNVFVIYSPVYYLYDEDPSIAICNDLCKKENVPFYDFSKDPMFLNKKELFADKIHVNQSGAILFSQLVVNKIKKVKDLCKLPFFRTGF